MTISLSNLHEQTAEVVARVASGGLPIVIVEGSRELAILVPHGASQTEALDKSELGFDPRSGAVGSASGRDLLLRELHETGVALAAEDPLVDAVYAAVLTLCEDKQQVFRADLKALADEVIAEAPGHYKLLALTVQTVSGMPATAEVTLSSESGPSMRRQQGDGPLDAAIRAIEKLTGLTPRVESFAAYSATPGRDAMAEAVIELRHEDRSVVGRGASTDAVAAGVHAYLNALNLVLSGE